MTTSTGAGRKCAGRMGCSHASVVHALRQFRGGACPRWQCVTSATAHVVRNRWVARNGCGTEASARDGCVMPWWQVCSDRPRSCPESNLIDVGAVVGEEFLGVRAALPRNAQRTLVFLPLGAKSLTGEIASTSRQITVATAKASAHADRSAYHVFRRHVSPRPIPRTSPGRGKMFRQRSSRERWR